MFERERNRNTRKKRKKGKKGGGVEKGLECRDKVKER